MLVILPLLVVLGVCCAACFRIMTAEERAQFASYAVGALRHAAAIATLDHPALRSFDEALRARTPQVLVTPAVISVNALVFVAMLFGGGLADDPGALVGWGASFGPRTANGEWWRLLTSMFVHTSLLHLLATTIGLVQVGIITERVVGPLAFGTVYVVAGVLASLVSLAAFPLDVSAGAAGATFGTYGLLLASSFWCVLRGATIAVPVTVAKSLIPAAAVLVLHSMASNALGFGAEITGFLTGIACGLVITRRVGEETPSPRFVAAEVAATLVIAVITAVPLRGIVDIRPEIGRIVAFEYRSSRAYQDEAARFREGLIEAEALAQVIDGSIVPELQEVRARVEAIGKVPRDHQPFVEAAREYLRLRDESWQVRSEALHEGKMPTLRRADEKERAALEAFHKLRPPSE